jgi:hypothetical protein
METYRSPYLAHLWRRSGQRALVLISLDAINPQYDQHIVARRDILRAYENYGAETAEVDR